MSTSKENLENKDGLGTKLIRFVRYTLGFLIKAVIAIGVLVGSSVALSKLGAIHGKDLPENYFSNGYPTILRLLDSEVFMASSFS